ncbi:hypothetical protein AOZ06_21540 [Kibdelosporangium phytohabitans]|uniref:HTH luxR-type domain-containing protein n=1 Tax=Kibdelosporangium phytohabitans TaxID=860235 RepID=A0A0N9I326_9PSEU|nr:hypothetical protein AOZ06_21540 [Kibdelosporangium phytohabitans]
MLVPNGLQVGGLTPREVGILRLLAEGMGTPAVAEAMKYSERTIKKDISATLSRLRSWCATGGLHSLDCHRS